MWKKTAQWNGWGMSILAGVAIFMGLLLAVPFGLIFAAPFVHAL